MKTKDIPYSVRNNIRTKLLLFIDNEIQTKIKNKLLPEFNTEKINSISQIIINFEETYTQYSNNEISKKSDSTNDDSPKKIPNNEIKTKRTSRFVGTVKQKFENGFDSFKFFNGKIFSISPVKKEITSPKKGKKFLKKLCENLKMTEKKERYHVNSNRTIITLCKIDVDDCEKKNNNSNNSSKIKSNNFANIKIKKEKKKEEKKQAYSLFRKMKRSNKEENC